MLSCGSPFFSFLEIQDRKAQKINSLQTVSLFAMEMMIFPGKGTLLKGQVFPFLSVFCGQNSAFDVMDYLGFCRKAWGIC